MIAKWLWGVVLGLATAAVTAVLVVTHEDERRAPNVVLISIDTLRADHLGCYGYARPTSPSIDEFCREAVRFRSAIAAAPSTLASHASIFTALAPQHHGASHVQAIPLADSFLSLAEVFRDAGYRTAAWTGGVQLAPEFGLTQGFETYEVVEDGTFAQVVERATPWLNNEDARPFFLFLHTYEVHHPYTPRAEDLRMFEPTPISSLPAAIDVPLLQRINFDGLKITDADLAHIVNTYDAEIVNMDRGFRQLVSQLKRLAIYDSTIMVFTSDHGEEFGEHGWTGWHSHSLYDELLRVPLIVRLPSGVHAGAAIDGAVSGIDIAPIILDAAGVEKPDPFDDFSLTDALARGRAPDEPALLWMEPLPIAAGPNNGLRTASWKFVDGRLYDLQGDPAERVDVSQQHPRIAAALASQVAAMINARRKPDTKAITPDEATLERLRSLGYIR
jgi:arylsulfatase A-like enzyme